MDHDPFELQRFVDAQEPLRQRVKAEMRAGRKSSHWMWFFFPQLRGLGKSEMAHRYGIASLAEARAYLAHPVLGPRLREACQLIHEVRGRSAHQIFGHPDDVKFRSCLTLFGRAAPDEPVFAACLRKYFAGVEDQATLALLR
jgi:uncharacterized protein (DUF1810 family)